MCSLHPDWQRQGIGTRLHEAALAQLRREGVQELRLGGGGAYRFWPGIPKDLPEAHAFFAACDWPLEPDRGSCDLVRDLRNFHVPPAMRARLEQEEVTVRPARENEVDDIIAFEWNTFPAGRRDSSTWRNLETSKTCFAIDPDKGIVGSLMLHTPSSRWLTAT